MKLLKNILGLGLALLVTATLQVQAITVTKAIYGAPNYNSQCLWIDVTTQAQSISKSPTGLMTASNAYGDPCMGTVKTLTIIDNNNNATSISEGKTIKASNVKKAYYGAGKAIDVTAQVQAIINSTTPASNTTFGFDPAAGIVKTLYITYSDGSTKSIGENGSIPLPTQAQAAAPVIPVPKPMNVTTVVTPAPVTPAQKQRSTQNFFSIYNTSPYNLIFIDDCTPPASTQAGYNVQAGQIIYPSKTITLGQCPNNSNSTFTLQGSTFTLQGSTPTSTAITFTPQFSLPPGYRLNDETLNYVISYYITANKTYLMNVTGTPVATALPQSTSFTVKNKTNQTATVKDSCGTPHSLPANTSSTINLTTLCTGQLRDVSIGGTDLGGISIHDFAIDVTSDGSFFID
ncbi:MAG: hypothetical protein P4L31_07905 [Candidatus Babeliales bacterium]|nr:hypothetical protein [Candidatus Babeliales bacterium]